METESETKIDSLEKEVAKLRADNKYLLEKVIKSRKEMSFARPSSKEKGSKENFDDQRLPSHGTMVVCALTKEELFGKL